MMDDKIKAPTVTGNIQSPHLEGKMTLELCDPLTGKVKERVEEKNMVTNALSQLLQLMGYTADPDVLMSTLAPFYKYLLGGLWLFDKTIDEDPDTMLPPADVKMVGCAAWGEANTTANKCRGTYNGNESEFANGTAKYIYDFATSKANGKISCACLTSRNAGMSWLGAEGAVLAASPDDYIPHARYGAGTLPNGKDDLPFTDSQGAAQTAHFHTEQRPFGYHAFFLADYDADRLWTLKADYADGTLTLTFSAFKAWMRTVSILDSPASALSLIEQQTVTVSDSAAFADMNTRYYSWNWDSDTDTLHIFANARGYDDVLISGDFIHIQARMDAQGQWAATASRITNQAGKRLRIKSFWGIKGYTVAVACYDDCAAAHEYYAIELANPANVRQLTPVGADLAVDYVPKYGVGGRLWWHGRGHSVLCLDASGRMLPTEVQYHSEAGYKTVPVKGRPTSSSFSFSSSYYYLGYLATINNLGTPVTKTADRTMKVTYTVTEA